MNVFTYWEGKKVPYIEACLDSVRYHCFADCRFHHVTPENFSKYVPDGVLHPNWKNIKELGVKSDCVRAACLFLYGGLYVDADTVMIRSPVGVIDENADCAYMTWSTPPRRAIAGYIYCRPGSPVAARWIENMNKKLAAGKWGWTEIGEGCLTPAIDDGDQSRMQILPLKTFLPIEIDLEVAKFFTKGNWKDHTIPSTVAFGLNHSWMVTRKPNEMRAWDSPQSELIIHQVLAHAAKVSKSEPSICVCVSSYKRPKLLGHLVDCFNRQEYANKKMVILEDSGEMASGKLCDNVWLVSQANRFATLGEKRNAVANTGVAKFSDILCVWDDDDLWMPWAMKAMAQACRRADWVRPSQILHKDGRGRLCRSKTHCEADQTDKAFQCAWAISRGAFDAVGGYPDDMSLGEDLVFAKRLREAGISEADPIEMGFLPYHVAAPYPNEHFSWTHKDYATWPEKFQGESSPVIIGPPDFSMGPMDDRVHPRAWQTNWWHDEIKS